MMMFLPWTPAIVASNEWSLPILMMIVSTFSTVTAPQDDIVIRVGWAFQDWNAIYSNPAAVSATSSSSITTLPVLVYVAALYMAVSDFLSMLLQQPKSES